MQQPLLSSQPTTILGSQPLYIRTAEPFVQQQTPSFAVANVQAVTPIRSKLITVCCLSLSAAVANCGVHPIQYSNIGLLKR